MKYCENICSRLRVIYQDKNRKLKLNDKCWQRTALNHMLGILTHIHDK